MILAYREGIGIAITCFPLSSLCLFLIYYQKTENTANWSCSGVMYHVCLRRNKVNRRDTSRHYMTNSVSSLILESW